MGKAGAGRCKGEVGAVGGVGDLARLGVGAVEEPDGGCGPAGGGGDRERGGAGGEGGGAAERGVEAEERGGLKVGGGAQVGGDVYVGAGAEGGGHRMDPFGEAGRGTMRLQHGGNGGSTELHGVFGDWDGQWGCPLFVAGWVGCVRPLGDVSAGCLPCA
jgi:hypothetical protein